MHDFPMDQAAGQEPEHYRTERAARHAHEIIEEMSRPKKREQPVEVQQAHRIGSLESDVNHLSRECQRLHSDLERAERERDDYRQKYQDRQKRFEEAIEDRNKYSRMNEAKNTTINNLRKKVK